MVFFNCNACGEALKKNQVEKHTLRCRNCEVLSCVDCGKDFWGNDYQAHVKCMTENEKYCGKGYVPKVNKGEVKQEQWIEKVQNAIEKSISNPKLKGLLERLKDYPNIPRKKSKFENFLKNSLRCNSDSLISQVWDTLMATSEQENGTVNGQAKADKTANGVKENGDAEGKAEKKQKSESQDNNTNENNNIDGKKKKEKKKKQSDREETIQEKKTVSSELTTAEVQENIDTQLPVESSVDEHKLSKRQRKEERRKKANKKEKKDKNENSSNNEEKRKGKKRKFSESEEVGEQPEVIVAEHSDKKKKKKKQVSESKEENDDFHEKSDKSECKEAPNDETSDTKYEVATVAKKRKKTKFNWESTILTALKSKGELSLKRLQKKVLSEFSAQDAANYSEENLTAKFEKKVKKMTKVKVFKDRVKLK